MRVLGASKQGLFQDPFQTVEPAAPGKSAAERTSLSNTEVGISPC